MMSEENSAPDGGFLSLSLATKHQFPHVRDDMINCLKTWAVEHRHVELLAYLEWQGSSECKRHIAWTED